MNRIIAGLGLTIIAVLALGMLHKQAHHRFDQGVKIIRDNHMSRGDLFDAIDTDDDEKVSLREMYAFINTNHRLLDLNEDGGVDKSEIKLIHKLLKNHGPPPKEVSGSPQSLAR